MEHGAFDIETVADIIKVACLCGIAPFVRVLDLDYYLLSRLLDPARG